ncbi:hypothetical protein N7537_007305 [Penicillium hordei]|uniref:Uncharacterized protein n=1 Tax=Penicillium hordei TaxID=40994 RepID=A0AAD6DYE5_9EURO|nr:uncharacterized protein N7537_007305 [Penicillium hordei]KAJ5597221.1 hypothetical protein N7537_007305 [Penicillium hordei]
MRPLEAPPAHWHPQSITGGSDAQCRWCSSKLHQTRHCVHIGQVHLQGAIPVSVTALALDANPP